MRPLQCSAAHSGTDTHMRSALDSLERIEQRQEESLARMDAANKLAAESTGQALEERLKSAGSSPAHRRPAMSWLVSRTRRPRRSELAGPRVTPCAHAGRGPVTRAR